MKCLKLCSSISALGLVSNLYLSGETKEGQEGSSIQCTAQSSLFYVSQLPAVSGVQECVGRESIIRVRLPSVK